MIRIRVRVIPTSDVNTDLRALSDSLNKLTFVTGVTLEDTIRFDKRDKFKYEGKIFYKLGNVLFRIPHPNREDETILMVTNEPVINWRDFKYTKRITIIKGSGYVEEKKALVSSYYFRKKDSIQVFHNVGGHELGHIKWDL